MEDENGLELSLGLSCGGSSIKSKVKTTSSSAGNGEQSDRSNKLAGDFENFLPRENQRQDSEIAPVQSNMILISSKDNFFNDLSSKVSVDRDSLMDLKRKGTWIESGNHYAETEDENLPVESNKHKFLFEEMNRQKKRERESHQSDLHEKTRTSRVSTTEDGSTAENEDAVESGAEGSTSRPVSKHDDGSKRGTGVTSFPSVSKEIRGFTGSSAVGSSGQKRFNSSIAAPNSVQTMKIQNVPYSLSVKDSSTIGAPSISGNLQTRTQHVLSTAKSDRSGAENVNPRNLPLMAGVSPLQISAMDKDKSRCLVSRPQAGYHSYAGGISTGSGMLYNGRPVEQTKSNSKQPAMDEGSPSRPEHMKGTNSNFNPADSSERSKSDRISPNFPAIKPGIAAEVEFGGGGSYPNLPWVSTTGPGSTGKTISGVTYRYSANQIKIVCACHGSHMSPEEFIRHAGEDNINDPNDNSSTTTPSKNSAASAQG